MTKIKSSNLDNDVITGLTEDTSPAADDVIIVYDTSATALKKVKKSNFALAAPEITSISPTVVDPDGSTTTNITINGTGFVNPPVVKFIGADATVYTSASVTFNTSVQIVAATVATMTAANGPYDVKIENGNNLTVTGSNLLTLDNAPFFSIAANTNLGSVFPGATDFSGLTVPAASDPESDAITHTIASGALPTGMTLNTNATFAGTVSSPLSDQDFTFTVRAATTNFSVDRQFVITNTNPGFSNGTGGTITQSGDYQIHTFNCSGCFVVSNVGKGCTVPSGGPAVVDYLVVAGGGGGAGGHGGPPDTGGGGGGGGYRTSGGSNGYTAPDRGGPPCARVAGITITATTYPITVGGGGSQGNSPFSNGGDGGTSTFSTITSAGGGGGRGGSPYTGKPGGSGGGGRGAYGPHGGGSGNSPPVSPPQGNSGGPAPHGSEGGGGGGAQGAGSAGNGGDGDLNDISGSQVGYSGGGAGGNGGGAPGAFGEGSSRADPADANRGGGGAGGPSSGGSGGKGVVIIRYKYQ